MIPMSVWVVEDDMAYRNTLTRMLRNKEHITDCRDFPSCIELFEIIESSVAQPDMVLMDLGLPDMSGVEGIKKLAKVAPTVTVVVLTVFRDKEKVMEALEAGAAGYLLKTSKRSEIITGLQEVFFGGSALSPAVAKLVLDEIRKPTPETDFKLTEREVEVLDQLALGLAIKEIAVALKITRSTCATHLKKIYSKLKVQSQSGAVAKALRLGIIK